MSTRAVYALLIINKAGGLVYNRFFTASTLAPLSSNDLLVLAGTFHGIHAISRTLSPLHNLPLSDPMHPANQPDARPKPSGIESLQTAKFLLSCYQTPTGTKFLLFTEPVYDNAETVLRKCYDLYADYVMKNPFYSLEMPIRCEKFEKAVQGWVGVR